MASRVVIVARYALGDSTPPPDPARRKASCTMSSASLTLPVIRYAIENISGRYSVYWLESTVLPSGSSDPLRRGALGGCDIGSDLLHLGLGPDPGLFGQRPEPGGQRLPRPAGDRGVA